MINIVSYNTDLLIKDHSVCSIRNCNILIFHAVIENWRVFNIKPSKNLKEITVVPIKAKWDINQAILQLQCADWIGSVQS